MTISRHNPVRQKYYNEACLDTLTFVANHLNTLEYDMISKKDLYKFVMNACPADVLTHHGKNEDDKQDSTPLSVS